MGYDHLLLAILRLRDTRLHLRHLLLRNIGKRFPSCPRSVTWRLVQPRLPEVPAVPEAADGPGAREALDARGAGHALLRRLRRRGLPAHGVQALRPGRLASARESDRL